MDPRPSRCDRTKRRPPRASGDGPTSPAPLKPPLRAAPRERGWTQGPHCSGAERRGRPARAGMDPSCAAARSLPCRLPRASGDGPGGDLGIDGPMTAAPRERGWTHAAWRWPDWCRGCPARAGMDPSWALAARPFRRLPRASGDGPTTRLACGVRKLAAPRERGWTPRSVNGHCYSPGCPARAGMDPSSVVNRWPFARLPRASGDGPLPLVLSEGASAAAPRERGWTLFTRYPWLGPLGCPARAGMDP